jgi:hypothetical protein
MINKQTDNDTDKIPRVVTKEIKGNMLTGTYIDENTIIIDGIGNVRKVGELDMRQFIRDAMSLPSFWR